MSSTEKDVVSTTTLSTNHAEAAQERVLELRRWREQIPRFVVPATPDATKRLATAASLPPEFVELTTVAIANQTALMRNDGLPPAVVRDLVTYADSYSPLADELEALAQFVRHSVTAARNKVGTQALLTYAMAQRLAKQPETAHLAPHVTDMRRALGRGRKASPETQAKRAAEKAAKVAEKAAKAAAKAAPQPDPSGLS